MGKIIKVTIGVTILAMTLIFFIFLAMITKNLKFIFVGPLTIGTMFIWFAILPFIKVDYYKWENGRGKVLYISTSDYDYKLGERRVASPKIVIEFIDKNGNRHKGRSQSFATETTKEIKEKYKTGKEVEFKYKLHEATTFKKIFGKEPFASIHIFDNELKGIDPKKGVILFGLLGIFFIFWAIIILIKY